MLDVISSPFLYKSQTNSSWSVGCEHLLLSAGFVASVVGASVVPNPPAVFGPVWFAMNGVSLPLIAFTI